MEFDYLKLAKIIKEAREDKGLSLRDLGYKIGISHAELSRFESGLKPNLSYITFIKMVEELELDLYRLINDVGLTDMDYVAKYDEKVYQVFILGKKTYSYKVTGTTKYNAIGIVFDFVMKNNLIELDKGKDLLMTAIEYGDVEGLKAVEESIKEYYETGRYEVGLL